MNKHIHEKDNVIVEGSKRCSSCGRAKPFSEFHRKADSKLGLHAYCKTCHRIYNSKRAGKPKTPEQRRRYLDWLKEHNRKPARRDAQRKWRKTSVGKLVNQLSNVRWRLRKQPTAKLKETHDRLIIEIERLRQMYIGNSKII